MKKFLLIPLSFAALLFSACSTYYGEDVAVNSNPQGAEVFVNGEKVGTTPCTTRLISDSTYTVKIQKEGYLAETFTLSPTAENPYVKFGPLVDTGFYKKLLPADVNAQLKPEYLPAYPGKDSFGDFSYNFMKLDALRKAGKISKEEYDYQLKVITEFYSKKSK